ncbi:S1C family serine protease [Desulfosporosinus sp. BICA1-9]|uniref:S1C family serine protease n=1 Tax=Desulfosporosinus sp. BICA1-9 TaxID=1531958 RepID=UPI00054C3E42|nr:serine protease [Desulfosporosinus sp. BICA1-9]KJS47273.1 MAG: trypsin [Peptococcaceae bacterium BRH_c23]KJS87472.1 MAG: trypsin [Desulfosporosinus sp. BICA1-9]HBW35888.1 serine protease [Desulfosporosinus sp.]
MNDDKSMAEENGEEQFDYEIVSIIKPAYFRKLVALLILLAFIAMSVPNLPYLLSNQLNFLDQNRALKEDDIVQRCKPAVVSIEAMVTNEFLNTVVKQGTGFNISTTGTIITNQHIVANASTITIRFGDGTEYYSKHYEVVPDVDIAIIRLKGNDLPTIALNINNRAQSGETVTIIGNPLGFEKISQRGTVGHFYSMKNSLTQVFDINVPINPGNSGSPVIDNQAKAVGIVFASTNVDINGKLELRALAIPIQVLPLGI